MRVPFVKEALVHSASDRPVSGFRSSSLLPTQGGGEGVSGGLVGHNELLVASLGCVRGRRSTLFLAYRWDISRKRIGGWVCE